MKKKKFKVKIIIFSSYFFYCLSNCSCLSYTPEVLSPAVVTVSEPGQSSVRVSWGPLQPGMVESYSVEYSALPTGKVHYVQLSRSQNSTLLRNLQPDTTYLVTVTARHASGKEKAMSVKVCTQEGEVKLGHNPTPSLSYSFCILNSR